MVDSRKSGGPASLITATSAAPSKIAELTVGTAPIARPGITPAPSLDGLLAKFLRHQPLTDEEKKYCFGEDEQPAELDRRQLLNTFFEFTEACAHRNFDALSPELQACLPKDRSKKAIIKMLADAYANAETPGRPLYQFFNIPDQQQILRVHQLNPQPANRRNEARHPRMFQGTITYPLDEVYHRDFGAYPDPWRVPPEVLRRSLSGWDCTILEKMPSKFALQDFTKSLIFVKETQKLYYCDEVHHLKEVEIKDMSYFSDLADAHTPDRPRKIHLTPGLIDTKDLPLFQLKVDKHDTQAFLNVGMTFDPLTNERKISFTRPMIKNPQSPHDHNNSTVSIIAKTDVPLDFDSVLQPARISGRLHDITAVMAAQLQASGYRLNRAEARHFWPGIVLNKEDVKEFEWRHVVQAFAERGILVSEGPKPAQERSVQVEVDPGLKVQVDPGLSVETDKTGSLGVKGGTAQSPEFSLGKHPDADAPAYVTLSSRGP